MPVDSRGHECTDRDVHSGQHECQKCWYWRKLDGPAARHWAKVSTEFLSNVDAYDWLTFFPERVGMPQTEFGQMIKSARRLLESCEAMIKEWE